MRRTVYGTENFNFVISNKYLKYNDNLNIINTKFLEMKFAWLVSFLFFNFFLKKKRKTERNEKNCCL